MSTVLQDTGNIHQQETTAQLTACLRRQREAYHADPVPEKKKKKKIYSH